MVGRVAVIVSVQSAHYILFVCVVVLFLDSMESRAAGSEVSIVPRAVSLHYILHMLGASMGEGRRRRLGLLYLLRLKALVYLADFTSSSLHRNLINSRPSLLGDYNVRYTWTSPHLHFHLLLTLLSFQVEIFLLFFSLSPRLR